MKKNQGIKIKNTKKDPDKTVSYSDIKVETFDKDNKLISKKVIKAKLLKSKIVK